MVVEGGRLAVEEHVMNVVPARFQTMAENAGHFLGAGALSLCLHENDPGLRLARGLVARDGTWGGRSGCRLNDAGEDHGLLAPRPRIVEGNLARVAPGDGSTPTRRRHAMVSANAMTTAETLHATAAPINPYAGPRIAKRRKRNASPAPMMTG